MNGCSEAWLGRVILHADMDAFYASIEQHCDPALRGRPVIVGGLGRRGVVAAASYEARAYGVHSAMPTARARRLCPHGVYLPPRMAHYAAVSAEVQALFLELTPLVEPLSLDEAFLDVSGSLRLFGSPMQIARNLKQRVKDRTGLTISVGVASNKYVAKVASDLRKPDGLVVVPPGEEATFLAPLEVGRLWGAGPVMQKRLTAVGLRLIGDLQRRSDQELVELLGANAGAHFAALCRGVDDRLVVVSREPRSIGHEVTFELDLTERQACHEVLLALSEKVAWRLRRAGLRGRVVKLKLRDPNFSTVQRQSTLRRACDDELAIYEMARRLFDVARPAMRPVRLLGVSVSALARVDPSEAEGRMDDSQNRRSELLRAIDSIKSRFGEGAIHHGRAGGSGDRSFSRGEP